MTEEINYKQRVENYKKFFKEYSGSWVGIEVEGETYYAFTSAEYKERVLNIKYKPYREVMSRLKYLGQVKSDLETMSKENTEETFQTYRDIVKEQVLIIKSILDLLKGMYIVADYTQFDNDFQIEWIHGCKPLNEE